MHSFPEWRFPAKHSSDPPALHRWFYRLRPSLFDTVPRSMSKERFEKKNRLFYIHCISFFCQFYLIVNIHVRVDL